LNVWTNDWSADQPEGRKRRIADGDGLGATLYELSKGGGIAYHFHPRTEELLLVLSGTLTLRTPQGMRELAPGAVVHFPAGPEGTHGITHDSDEPVRYVVVSTRVSDDATVYPEA
jgi:uncharacterized cupin superfamily protein